MSALNGISVIELSRLGPGPFCGMVLGDMGAEVVRVEEPTREPLPRSMRTPGVDPKKELARHSAFNAHNRNKKSIVLNLKEPAALTIIHKMVESTDILIEGYRPGVPKRLKIDYDTLKDINPGLIYCSISGFGQDGPYSSIPGHDLNYLAAAGAAALIGKKDGPPTVPFNLMGDYAGGSMQALVGILAALYHREQTGKGQYVDISMTDGVTYMLAATASDFFMRGTIPEREKHLLSGSTPAYNVYETKDGKYITIGCLEPHFWTNLCNAVGKEEFIPIEFDEKSFEKIFSEFKQIFLTKTRDEWFELFKDKNIAVSKVLEMDELSEDPQIKAREMVIEVGKFDGETIKQVGIGPKLSLSPGSVRSLGPTPGQHSDEIAKSLGYSEDEITDFRNQGAMG